MKKICMLFAFLLTSCSYLSGTNNFSTYQCGAQVVGLNFVDDESVVLNIDGQNYFLNQINTSVGEQYINDEETISIQVFDNDVYVTINGDLMPLCYQIKQ